jgi:hypothetical protein
MVDGPRQLEINIGTRIVAESCQIDHRIMALEQRFVHVAYIADQSVKFAWLQREQVILARRNTGRSQ